MRSLLTFISVLFISSNVMADNLHKFTINDIDGNLINLNQFKGKPILLVNTALPSSMLISLIFIENI